MLCLETTQNHLMLPQKDMSPTFGEIIELMTVTGIF